MFKSKMLIVFTLITIYNRFIQVVIQDFNDKVIMTLENNTLLR